VSGIFNHPIKGFGVLSGYASRKIGQYTPLGRQTLSQVHPALSSQSAQLEQGVAKLAQSVETALRTYGKGIIGQQLVTKRLSDSAMELFVGMCVLSRVTSLISAKGAANAADELRIARVFTHNASQKVAVWLKGIGDNQDKELCALADSIIESGRFSWDVL
jgi:alkylation response protein AidB-like acyl-CoA dehydrogenase